MPTEYLKYAIDGDGDGKIDIWRSVADALAFTARQLEGKGWVRGERWGYEVIAPPKADCSLEGPPDARPIGDWVKMGFRKASGPPFTQAQLAADAYLMMPAGAYGPAFLAAQNFRVIRLYNTSDLYALFRRESRATGSVAKGTSLRPGSRSRSPRRRRCIASRSASRNAAIRWTRSMARSVRTRGSRSGSIRRPTGSRSIAGRRKECSRTPIRRRAQ